MPLPLLAAAAASIAPALAKQGLDLLSGVFRGALNKGIQEIAKLIEDKTGIDINDVADNKLTESQWVKLKDFEFQLKWTHTDKPPALGRRPFASSLRH